jgi:hypothetical protein
MKIGLSYSRCVRDIVEGKVDIADVLVIIARTDFDPNNDEQWKGIWEGYAGGSNRGSMIRMFAGANPEWSSYGDEDEDLFRSVSIELYDSGKLHQPRKFGAYPRRLPYYWLNTFLPDNELDNNPAAKKAFEKFQMLAGLTNGKPVQTEHE